MAFRLSGSDAEELPLNHDINVTPFIDVMLVLLIIFMVAAPLATVDVKVELPVANADPSQRPDEPVYLTIEESGRLTVNDRPVELANLGAEIAGVSGGDIEQRVFLRADKAVPYERIMDAMNALRSAGYLRVALMGAEGGTAS
ncbi:TonB system transport protein ExbD [Croceicoccus bisphenolivorans]|uniref:TonB system transport protein ExbD n=1 Tax=Croceicoccus bisphenolivorans TaxID=1783232 RepID=UPI000829A928|nr:TonB system transport protein ExbD [Croceicoccus bisphenolivorans]